VLIGFVSFVATAARATESSAGLALTLEEAILKIVEGADTRDILGGEAANDGIERIVVHHINPNIKAGDTTFHHGKTRAQHGHGVAGRSTSMAGIENAKERVSQIEIGPLQLLPDTEMSMIGAQATIATSFAGHETNVLAMWEG
jgi:hypothetical protein